MRRDSYYDSSPRTESSVDQSRHVKSFSDDSGGMYRPISIVLAF